MIEKTYTIPTFPMPLTRPIAAALFLYKVFRYGALLSWRKQLTQEAVERC